MQTFFIAIGVLIVIGLGYFLKDWRILAWVCLIPGKTLTNELKAIFMSNDDFHVTGQMCIRLDKNPLHTTLSQDQPWWLGG